MYSPNAFDSIKLIENIDIVGFQNNDIECT